MVTNYPQQFTAVAQFTREATVGALASASKRLSQLLCGARGHDGMMHREGRRVMMRCTSCGHDTPGWEVSERGPRQRFEGDKRRHQIVAPRLVLRKSA